MIPEPVMSGAGRPIHAVSVPVEEDNAMSLNDVSTILWRERQLLELLLFKLEEEQLLLAAGRGRWLARAANEVETVLEEIKMAELARCVEVDAVAAQLGLGADASLGSLIEASPAPWNGILADHRDAFLSMTQEILSVAGSNRELLNRGQRAVRDALSFIGGPDDDTYTPTGGRADRSGGALLVNEVL